MDFPGGSNGKESTYNAGPEFDPWVGKIPWRKAWQPTPLFLLEESPWREEFAVGATVYGLQRVEHNWDHTQHIYTEIGASQVTLVVKNLSVNVGDIRETGLIPGTGRSPGIGHDNPLQYSCQENPIDRGAWEATVHRITQRQSWLKQLSMYEYRERETIRERKRKTETERNKQRTRGE